MSRHPALGSRSAIALVLLRCLLAAGRLLADQIILASEEMVPGDPPRIGSFDRLPPVTFSELESIPPPATSTVTGVHQQIEAPTWLVADHATAGESSFYPTPDWLVAGVAAGATPSPIASFAALGDNGCCIPPDTMGAVSARYLMTTLNSQYRVQERSGRIVSTVDNLSFWTGTGGVSRADPVIVFDWPNGRWILVQMDSDATGTGALDIAVSQNDDPTGVWNRFRSPARAGEWYDQPTVGFNQTTVTISVNVISIKGDFLRVDVFLVDKAQLYGGSVSSVIVSTASGFSLCPAVVHDAGVTANYLLENYTPPRVRLYEASRSGLRLITSVVAPALWNANQPGGMDFAPQLGSANRINVGDARIHAVVLRNGYLWFAQTCFLPYPTPTRSAIQWWKISVSGELLDFGRIDDPVGGTSYGYPTIAVNRYNDAVIGFSQFSASQFAGAGYAFRSTLDPKGSFRSPVVLKSGEASYYKVLGGQRNRWGDYSNTMVDGDDASFWTIQEYAASPVGGSDRWGTWWGHIPNQTSSQPPTLYSDLVLGDHPFAYYKLNERSGATAYDSSGNVRHGRYVSVGVGQVTFNGPSPGQSDVAAAFNGTGSYVQLPGTWGGTAWKEVTIEAWAQIESTGDFESIVSATGESFVHLQYNSYGNVAVYTDKPAGSLPYLPLPILYDSTQFGQWKAPNWHHVAVVAKSGESCLYVNGALYPPCVTSEFSYVLASSNVRIGAGYGGARFLKGAIAHVAIYDHALLQAELEAHYYAPFVRSSSRRRPVRRP